MLVAYCAAVRIITPPVGIKDAREWYADFHAQRHTDISAILARSCQQIASSTAAKRGRRLRIVANGPTIATGQKRPLVMVRKSLVLRTLATKKPHPAGRGEKRRARESNPQPLTGHFISNEAAHHSHTLRRLQIGCSTGF